MQTLVQPINWLIQIKINEQFSYLLNVIVISNCTPPKNVTELCVMLLVKSNLKSSILHSLNFQVWLCSWSLTMNYLIGCDCQTLARAVHQQQAMQQRYTAPVIYLDSHVSVYNHVLTLSLLFWHGGTFPKKEHYFLRLICL